jgi:hypothetical protein
MDGWDVWLCLGEDSHGPLQVVLAGLVDLDDLSSLKSFFTLSFQWPSVMELHWMDGSMDGWIDGWMDQWLRFGEDSQVPHQLDLVGLGDLGWVDLTSPRSGPQSGNRTKEFFLLLLLLLAKNKQDCPALPKFAPAKNKQEAKTKCPCSAQRFTLIPL